MSDFYAIWRDMNPEGKYGEYLTWLASCWNAYVRDVSAFGPEAETAAVNSQNARDNFLAWVRETVALTDLASAA